MSHSAEKRKRSDPSGFFIIQLGAENQNNHRGDPLATKSLTMPKKPVKPNLLSCLVTKKCF